MTLMLSLTAAADFSRAAFSSASSLIFMDLFHAAATQLHRHAEEHILQAILALHVSRGRDDQVFVLQDRFRHLRHGHCRSIISRTGLEQIDDLPAALAGAVDDRFQFVRRQVFTQRYTGHIRMAGQRHHLIAMTAHHIAVDIFHADTGLQGHERPHAGRIQDARLPDNALARQLADLHGQVCHRIQRVGQNDEDGLRRILEGVRGCITDDLGVDGQQVFAAHTRLARHARRDDDDIGTLGGSIIIAADHGYILADHRQGFLQVQGLALWHPFDDIHQHQVGDFTFGQPMGGGGTGHSGANNGNFCSHLFSTILISH